MSGVNRVTLVGHLGGDPTHRVTPNGTSVANFTVATTMRFSDNNGDKQERTEWHRIVVWAKLADICNEYLKKGKQVYLEGRLQTRSWEDKDGAKRWTTEVVANQMVMLGKKDDRTEAPVSDAPAQTTPPSDDDDLPF